MHIRVKGINPTFQTTIIDGHKHLWIPGQKFTSIMNGHRHRVSGGIALPIKRGEHFHTVLS